jgi:ribosomal protein S26
MNVEFLNQLKPPQKRDYGRKKKNRGDEPIWAIIHLYMEVPQGNSLCRYLKQAKMSFFFFYKI